jgi:hypothetical protein
VRGAMVSGGEEERRTGPLIVEHAVGRPWHCSGSRKVWVAPTANQPRALATCVEAICPPRVVNAGLPALGVPGSSRHV